VASDWLTGTKAWALVALIFLGSMALALLVPIAAVWALSHVSGTKATSFYLGLMGCPIAIVAWAAVLGKLNIMYQQVTGRRDSNVLEMSLAAAVLAALVVFLVLMIFFNSPDSTELGPLPT
jgi:uncharacterized membrane protein